jgi:hypothetical protein
MNLTIFTLTPLRLIIVIIAAALICFFTLTPESIASYNTPSIKDTQTIQSQLDIKATIIPEKATVGQTIEYKLNIIDKDHAKIKVIPPEKRELYQPQNKDKTEEKNNPDDKVPIYIIHKVTKNDRSDKSITDITVTLTLSYYRPGRHMLPEIKIKYNKEENLRYKVPEIEITTINKDGSLHEIEPPLELSGNYSRLIILIATVFTLTLIGVTIAWYVRKKFRKKREAISTQIPIEIFMDEIYAFGGNKLIEDGRIEDYIFGISTIFRRFLSAEFGFDAIEMTTEEIKRALSNSAFKKRVRAHEDDIIKSFNMWDLSKFAEFTPSKELLTDNLNQIIKTAKAIAISPGSQENVSAGI